MKKMYWILFAFLTTLKSGAQVPGGQTPAQVLPDFTFYRMDQKYFKKSDLPGGRMMLFVFFDPGCEHCQKAAASLDKQHESLDKTAVFFVSTDPPEMMTKFMTSYAPHLKNRRNVTLLYDGLNQFISKFKPFKYPAMFLYSASGQLVDYEDNEETVFRLINNIKKNHASPAGHS
ncbi:MAG TPA: redoxin domain-containing protein [Puia sp.]|nr:redoxin domain-containing protein [Puia sp.]